MVTQASDYATRMGGLPIIYAGDFNSDPSKKHNFNGPSDYNLAQGMSDSFDVAQTRTNAQYNSANGYLTKPPADGYRLDYMFVTAGIAVHALGPAARPAPRPVRRVDRLRPQPGRHQHADPVPGGQLAAPRLPDGGRGRTLPW